LTHALFRGSRIFPGLELCDNHPDYTFRGLTDTWRGEYHGEPVCVKVVRAQLLRDLRVVERVWRPFYLIGGTQLEFASCQTYHRVVKESKLNSHPNVLPVIRVSEELFPFCIMSPWMPDGNITQYIGANPGADRPMLVRARRRRLMGIIY